MGRKVHQLACVLDQPGLAGPLVCRRFTVPAATSPGFYHPQPVSGNHAKGGAAKDTDVRKLRKDLPDTIKNGKAGISRGSRALSWQDPSRHPHCQTRHPDRPQGRRCQEDPACASKPWSARRSTWISRRSSPDTGAVLVARNVADQLERRIATAVP